jgi:hypothetical protein
MTSGALYTRATAFLYGKLTTPAISGASGVHEITAPQGATDRSSKWIEYEAMSPGEDVAEVAEQRIWTEFAFRIVAASRTESVASLEAIADEIYARLHRSDGSVTGAYVVSCVRTEEIVIPDLAQGVEYRELGGFYNLIVQAA